METKKGAKFYIISIIRYISAIIILICIGIMIYRYFNLKRANEIIDSVSSDVEITNKDINVNGITTNVINADISKLDKQNSDSVGYIKVNGTNINYPVVQGDDNEFYLRHSFDKTYSQSGWIFLDYRNDAENLDKNTIIYGHNMLNKTMFSTLTNLTNSNFFNNTNNNYINLTIKNKPTVWKIFSVYVTNPETYYTNIGFSNKSDYLNFLNTIKTRSMFNFDTNLNENDKILTLSTCANLNTKRLVVHAKLIYQE